MRKSSRQSTTGSPSRSWCLRRHASIALEKSSSKLSFALDICRWSRTVSGQEQARDRLDFRIEFALPSQEALAVEEVKARVLGSRRDGEILPVQALDEPLLHSSHGDFLSAKLLQQAHANRAAI